MWYNIWLLPLILILTGCKVQEPIKLVGEAQGTYYSIIYYDEQDRDLQHEIDSLLVAFDQSVSLWVPESIISKVNNNDNDVRIDKFFTDNFMISQQVSNETQGAFDITIGPLVRAWGFGYDGTTSVDSTIIDSLLKIVGYKKIDLFKNVIIKDNPNIKIDFNAVAQGYSVDLVAGFLESREITNFLVDIGGEVIARGNKPNDDYWKVGIEKPSKNADAPRILNAIIKLKNSSIATSGNYRKFIEVEGKRFSHIIDPKTGYPSKHNLLSVTIIADNTAFADAYATACMIMGMEKSIDFIESKQNLEAFFIFASENGEYDHYSTNGFKKLLISDFN